MKTLAIDGSSEFRAIFDEQMLVVPLKGQFILELLSKTRMVYLLDDLVATETPFAADRLVDENGESHTVTFPVLKLEDREGDRWAIGEEYQINLTEFFNEYQALIEDFLREHPERR